MMRPAASSASCAAGAAGLMAAGMAGPGRAAPGRGPGPGAGAAAAPGTRSGSHPPASPRQIPAVPALVTPFRRAGAAGEKGQEEAARPRRFLPALLWFRAGRGMEPPEGGEHRHRDRHTDPDPDPDRDPLLSAFITLPLSLCRRRDAGGTRPGAGGHHGLLRLR